MAQKPDAPRPLEGLNAWKAEVEKQRASLFPVWRAVLEKARGNVTRGAYAYFFPEGAPMGKTEADRTARQRAKDHGWAWTRSLGLADYAKALRAEAGQGLGRPKKTATDLKRSK